jgi:hypothetical protein
VNCGFGDISESEPTPSLSNNDIVVIFATLFLVCVDNLHVSTCTTILVWRTSSKYTT